MNTNPIKNSLKEITEYYINNDISKIDPKGYETFMKVKDIINPYFYEELGRRLLLISLTDIQIYASQMKAEYEGKYKELIGLLLATLFELTLTENLNEMEESE